MLGSHPAEGWVKPIKKQETFDLNHKFDTIQNHLEEVFKERLSQSGEPEGMSCLDCHGWHGDHHVWHGSLGLGLGLWKSGESVLSTKHVCIHFSLLWSADVIGLALVDSCCLTSRF